MKSARSNEILPISISAETHLATHYPQQISISSAQEGIKILNWNIGAQNVFLNNESKLKYEKRLQEIGQNIFLKLKNHEKPQFVLLQETPVQSNLLTNHIGHQENYAYLTLATPKSLLTGYDKNRFKVITDFDNELNIIALHNKHSILPTLFHDKHADQPVLLINIHAEDSIESTKSLTKIIYAFAKLAEENKWYLIMGGDLGQRCHINHQHYLNKLLSKSLAARSAGAGAYLYLENKFTQVEMDAFIINDPIQFVLAPNFIPQMNKKKRVMFADLKDEMAQDNQEKPNQHSL